MYQQRNKAEHVFVISIIPVVQHIKNFKHNIDLDNVNILDQDTNWFNHGVKEAINIHPSSLNRDKVRHDLPPTSPSSCHMIVCHLGHVTTKIANQTISLKKT